jgi:hypothetical protein
MAGPAQTLGVIFFASHAVRITSDILDDSLRFHLLRSGLNIVQPKYDDIDGYQCTAISTGSKSRACRGTANGGGPLGRSTRMDHSKHNKKPKTQSARAGGPPRPPKKTARGFDDDEPDPRKHLTTAEREQLRQWLATRT